MGELKIEYVTNISKEPVYNLGFTCKLTGSRFIGRRGAGAMQYILLNENKNEKFTISRHTLRKKFYADRENKSANLTFVNRPRQT